MDKHIIGENAGILWRFLNTDAHKKWQLAEIKKGTGLDDLELASAIGWLAREDKIQFELQYPNGKNKQAFVYLMLNVYF
ncbi:winged helix-turn-helix domain-containing protein [Phocaeicola plebeius]